MSELEAKIWPSDSHHAHENPMYTSLAQRSPFARVTLKANSRKPGRHLAGTFCGRSQVGRGGTQHSRRSCVGGRCLRVASSPNFHNWALPRCDLWNGPTRQMRRAT